MGMPRPVDNTPTPPDRVAKVANSTEQFDEYVAPPRKDEKGNPIRAGKGLRTGMPPIPSTPSPQEPLTKANLAKGIGIQEPDTMPPRAPSRSVPPLPPPPSMATIDATEQFEEYRRPGFDNEPHSQGLRAAQAAAERAAQGPRADEILKNWKEPTPEVVTPKRFTMNPVPAAHEDPLAPAPAGVDVKHDASGLTERRHADELATAPAQAIHPVPAIEAQAVHEPPAPRPAPAVVHTPFVAAPAPPTPAAPPAAGSAWKHAPDAPGMKAGSGKGYRLAIVQADFNRDITDAMAVAAQDKADELGCKVVFHHHVPGIFETPLAAQLLLERGDVDGVIVIAVVIQGETGHDEVITNAAAQQILRICGSLRKPIGFGVTGPRMTHAQALARIGSASHAVEAVVASLGLMT